MIAKAMGQHPSSHTLRMSKIRASEPVILHLCSVQLQSWFLVFGQGEPGKLQRRQDYSYYGTRLVRAKGTINRLWVQGRCSVRLRAAQRGHLRRGSLPWRVLGYLKALVYLPYQRVLCNLGY